MTSGLCCQVTQSVSGCVTLRTNGGCKCLNKATVLGDKTSRALVSRIRCIFGKLQQFILRFDSCAALLGVYIMSSTHLSAC